MNGRGFIEWLKHRWKLITVRDGLYFRFIWTMAIAITLITVLVSAGVTAAAIKKEEAAAAAEEEKQKAEKELELLASYTNAQEAAKATDTDALPWNLIYVSKDHPLPKDFKVPEFTELVNGHRVDSRIYPDLQKLVDAARDAGYSPYITSSYIEYQNQDEQLQAKIDELMEAGETQEQAEVEAKAFVAEAGTSEHETGLAFDMSSDMGEEDETALWKWLEENSYKYGFIIRYPKNKASITGVDNDQFHLRYVGIKDATAMNKNKITLEEYLGVK